jgi:hypothetical protein
MNLFGLLKSLFHKSTDSGTVMPSQKEAITVGKSVDENLRLVKDIIRDDDSLTAGKVTIRGGELTAGVVYLNGLVDQDSISRQIVERLVECPPGGASQNDFRPKGYLEALKKGLITNLAIKETFLIEELTCAILDGNTAVFLEGVDTALIIDTAEFAKRAVEKPDVETSLLGSKESFVEDIKTNKVLLRRRLPIPGLRFRSFRIGRLSRTRVYVAWLEGIANPKIVEEAFRRIGRIDIDYVYSTGLIIELIEDNPLSIWPQYKTTEVPEVAAANLSEGRIAIFCDGFPQAIVVPLLIFQELQTTDDYGQKFLTGSMIRMLRYLAVFIAMLASPLYLAFVAYNHTVIPSDLASHIAAGRKGVPFPSVLEVLFMTVVIDILREAGIKLPRALGSAIGILGAVVIGQAAVAAGYVSPPVIIIISVTAIATFVIPSYPLSGAIRVANYLLVFLAAVSGFFGVIIGSLFLLTQIIALRSFGIPLSYPATTGFISSLRDILVRAPIRGNKKRPELLAHGNETRMGQSAAKPDQGNRKRGGRR